MQLGGENVFPVAPCGLNVDSYSSIIPRNDQKTHFCCGSTGLQFHWTQRGKVVIMIDKVAALGMAEKQGCNISVLKPPM